MVPGKVRNRIPSHSNAITMHFILCSLGFRVLPKAGVNWSVCVAQKMLKTGILQIDNLTMEVPMMKKIMTMPRFAVLGLLVAVALACTGGYILAQVEADITVSPQTLKLSSNSTSWVTVHTNLPYGAVLSASVTLNGVPISWSKADDRGYFVAKFQIGAIKGIAVPPSVELTFAGTLKDGQTFSGTDTVSVIE